MNAVKQATWLFITLFCLACSGWYFASKDTVFQLDDKALEQSIDITIRDMVVRQFASDGKLTHYLKTPLMHHTPIHSTHYLQSPHIIIKQPNKQPWEIHSKHATALYNGKQITFNEQVTIHQNQDAYSDGTHLKTEEMTYFPESKFATTLKKVEFTQRGSIVTSMGMNAFLEENRVQLLSQAQGIYVPAQG